MLVRTKPDWPDTPKAYIHLQSGLYTLVDPCWFEILNLHKWYAKKSFGKYYACRKVLINGKIVFLRMHRIIANTPPHLVCHHINNNSFDNRMANLQNMTWYEHAKMYSYR